MQHHHQVIVVGSGPAGLAAAACLGLNSIPYILLERDDHYAPIWTKKSYDRLHLHLANQFCQLPHMSFPPKSPTYVSRDEFVKYLDRYVSKFGIRPLYNRSVELAEFDEESKLWNVKVRKVDEDGVFEEFKGKYLVVASGETTDAFVPKVEGLGSFKGDVIHSTQYKNGKEFENKSVLVIGSGNSGMEIALDLANFNAKASIVVRSPGNGVFWFGNVWLPSIPPCGLILGVAKQVEVWRSVKIWDPKTGRNSLFDEGKYGKYPVMDVGTIEKIKSGEIQVLPTVRSVKGGGQVEFENGKCHSFDVIIFATGFKRNTSKWLKGDDYLLDEDGLPKPHFPDHWKGKKGLYCMGLSRRGLYGISLDAVKIADDIKSLARCNH